MDPPPPSTKREFEPELTKAGALVALRARVQSMRTSALLASATLFLFAPSLSGCGDSSTDKQADPIGEAQLPPQCSALQASGVAPGQIAPGVTLRDGEGKAFNPQQFCDQTVLLIAGSMF